MVKVDEAESVEVVETETESADADEPSIEVCVDELTFV